MASSFISFKDNGFWARDGFVEAFQLLIFEEIQLNYNDSIEWLNKYKKELAFQSLPLISGGMSMCLDETLSDQIKTDTILLLIDKIKKKIKSDQNYITGQHLNNLRRIVRQFLVKIKECNWTEEEIEKEVKATIYNSKLPINNYERGFELLQKLIMGQLSYKADSLITYWD